MLKKIILVVVSVSFIGCAHKTAKQNTPSPKASPAIVTQPSVKPITSLPKKEKIGTAARDVAWLKNAKKTRRIELQSSAMNRVSEEEAFAKVKAAYDSKNKDLIPLATAFVRRFPKSSLIDDVTYTVGLAAFESRDYGRALRSWNMVISDFPQSQRRVSALLAKAVLLKKIDMSAESKKTFLDLVKQYPKSPEAERAQIELRLMQ